VKQRISDEQFSEAIATAHSAASAMRSLGRRPAGGNYRIFYSRIVSLGLSTKHWTGRGHLRGRTHSWGRKAPLERVLVRNSPYQGGSYKLKLRLVEAGLLSSRCESCGISRWLGANIALHLDHRNGDNRDNRLFNLRLLCPNCHSQTATYCGKNKRLRRLSRPTNEPTLSALFHL